MVNECSDAAGRRTMYLKMISTKGTDVAITASSLMNEKGEKVKLVAGPKKESRYSTKFT